MKRLISIFFIASCVCLLHAQQQEPVKIGYLIQDKSYIYARQGAELAVKMANEKGGLNSRPFQVIVKSMEGPWGTGSKQAVDLIFNDRVWALLGTHDGRNAHLVEQAATKSTTVFISAWPSDPTLSYAFVPWYFNVVPSDLQQATMLISEIYDRKKMHHVAVITDDSYESKQSLKAFQRIITENKKIPASVINFENFKTKPGTFFNEIRKSAAQCILLYTDPVNSATVVKTLKDHDSALPVYSSLAVLNENVLTAPQLQELNEVLKMPTGILSNENMQNFRKTYFKTYGTYPGLAAAFAFDGMNVLIEAIRKCKSSDRELIQNAIAGMDSEGVTGRIAFDEHGNRKYLILSYEKH